MMASRDDPFPSLFAIAEIEHFPHSARGAPASGLPKFCESRLDLGGGRDLAGPHRGNGGIDDLQLFRRCDIFVASKLAVGFRVRGHDRIIPPSGLVSTVRRLRQSPRLPN